MADHPLKNTAEVELVCPRCGSHDADGRAAAARDRQSSVHRAASRSRPVPMSAPKTRAGQARLNDAPSSSAMARREFSGGYVVRDANGFAVAYVYGRSTEAEAIEAKQMTMDEARRVASNIAKLLKRGE